MPLLPVLKRVREEFERRGVDAFIFLDDVSIGMSEITPNTVRDVPFLRHELCKRGIAIKPSKTVALPPKGHVPTPEEIGLPGGIDVRIAERGEVKGVGVPVGRDACTVSSAVEIVRNGGADKLLRILPSMYVGGAVGEPHCRQHNGAEDFLHKAGTGHGAVTTRMSGGRH